MKSNFLKYSWKGMSGYSYGYILITNKFSISDIISCNKKIVLWGWRPEFFSAKCILQQNNINIDYACDVLEPFNSKNSDYDIPVRNYRELLKEQDKYYFIIALKNSYDIDVAMKLIQYAGYDEFGIVCEGFTKDFNRKDKLQKVFFESINEVFGPFDFLYDKSNLENIKMASLAGAGYWDVPYMIIYDLYKKKYSLESNNLMRNSLNAERLTYLEIGPGIGIMSLSLKKLLDIDVTWITIPNEEARWSEIKRDTTLHLLEKYNINIKTGFIETDYFTGEYDIIVIAQVMEHLVFNPVNTFKKLANLLSDTGYIFCSVPQECFHYNVQNYHEMPYPEQLTLQERERRVQINEFGHFHEYSYAEAMDVFNEAGLECVFHQWTSPIHHFMLRKCLVGQEPEPGVLSSLKATESM